MQKAVVRMYFENGTHKSFLILPKTSVADLIIPVQKKFQTISNYTLYYSVKGSAETALASTDNPWNVWKQHGENVKFTFKKGGSKTPPAVAPRGQRPAPKQATPSYATPSYATPGNAGQSGGYNKPQPTPAVSDAGGLDDFDALLSQLTDMDPSSSSTSSTGGYGLDALDQGSGNSCSACGKPITSKANELFAFGMYWHRDHLACAACKRNFLENNVKLIEGQDGQAYCEPDFLQRFAPKCKKCTHPIQGQVTNALGSQWHPQCFTCWTCDAPFQGTFFECNGNAYCERHYYDEKGLVCPACDKPIIGKCVMAKNQRYHPAHFVCSHCKTKLAGNEYFFHNDNLYCKNCSVVFYG